MHTDGFRARLGIAARRLAAVGLVLCLTLSLLRFVDFDRPLVLLGIVALAPWALAAIGLVFAASYGWRKAVAAGVVCVVIVALWMPGTVIPRTGCDVSGDADQPRAVVMSHNTLVGNADVEAIVAQVRHVNPDVLLLQEVTTEFRPVIGAELAEHYPYRQYHQLQAVFSRWPLTDIVVAGNSNTGGALIATVDRPNGSLRIANVHASAPTNPDRRANQRAEFAEMTSWRLEENVDLMMGDFNASAAHMIYRNVVNDRYVDAHRSAGCGFGATWTMRPARGPAVLQLDHALVSERWLASNFEVLDFANSDHKAIAVSIEQTE